MRSIGTVFLLVLWSDVPASAQPAGEAHKIDYETAPLERRLLAERCLGGIVVDGSLGEADWQSAPVATNFIQSEPREGAPATYDTEVRTPLQRRLSLLRCRRLRPGARPHHHQ